MPRQLALLIFGTGILGLFVLDREKETKTSYALWLPVVWLMIGASRNISTWLSWGQGSQATAESYVDGSPLDGAILACFVAVGLIILAIRARRSKDFLVENWPILLFFAYCLFSVFWSDFPFVTFKRWTKGLGNITMVLIVLTDPNPRAAVKRFLTRAGFVLIPVSIMLIKYFPEMGRGYDRWTGMMRYYGAVGDKNGLGYDCLIFGLASMWALIQAFRNKSNRLRQLAVHGMILLMVLWLLHVANSATSLACFALGTGIMLSITFFGAGKPWRIHALAGSIACAGLLLLAFPDLYAAIVQLLGRNTTLTGRVDLWDDLLQMHSNPWIGTGFESFFLGNRLTTLWAKYWWHPQEAHDGYLETYLTLGWIGLMLLALLALTGYRNIIASYKRDPQLGVLRLSGLFAALVYNGTEAAFKIMHPILILFLLSVAAVPASPLAADEPVVDMADDVFGPKLREVRALEPSLQPVRARIRKLQPIKVSAPVPITAPKPALGHPRNHWDDEPAVSVRPHRKDKGKLAR